MNAATPWLYAHHAAITGSATAHGHLKLGVWAQPQSLHQSVGDSFDGRIQEYFDLANRVKGIGAPRRNVVDGSSRTRRLLRLQFPLLGYSKDRF